MPNALPRKIIAQLIDAAFQEDLAGYGDLTTQSLIDPKQMSVAKIVARKDGIVAGIGIAESAFHYLDDEVIFKSSTKDGQRIKKGAVIATVKGHTSSILSAERVALNFLGHMSGVASLTHEYVKSVRGTKAKICCTRKTLPGLRLAQKYAVRMGGGQNHRFGLFDGVLIKDNHIAAIGDIGKAVATAKKNLGHMTKVAVEIDHIAQIEPAIKAGADSLLLDNMTLSELKKAVKLINSRVVTEASGGVSLETVKDIAHTGIDLISIGKLTHSAACLDIGLDFE